ncbi:RNA-splicing factor [Borealophlyctis nickersoniae]|nr:RNA-splicing factor [Borealophlyctis nickersoniae]
MYNGIGLTTARGSGTNGYVQRNLSALRPREKRQDQGSFDDLAPPSVLRKPNQDILDHERKRQVELQCLLLQENLEEQGLSEETVQERVTALRSQLTANLKKMTQDTKELREHQVHQLAEAKEKKNAEMQRAFGIGSDFVEGAAFDRELQEEKKQERIEKRAQEEEERRQRAIEAEKARKKQEKERRKQEREQEKERAKERERALKERERALKEREARNRRYEDQMPNRATGLLHRMRKIGGGCDGRVPGRRLRGGRHPRPHLLHVCEVDVTWRTVGGGVVSIDGVPSRVGVAVEVGDATETDRGIEGGTVVGTKATGDAVGRDRHHVVAAGVAVLTVVTAVEARAAVVTVMLAGQTEACVGKGRPEMEAG